MSEASVSEPRASEPSASEPIASEPGTSQSAGQPVEFVGGQPDPPRPKLWPYWVGAAVLVVLAIAAVVAWRSISAAGRSVGEVVAPYDLTITGGWTSRDKVVQVPIGLVLTVTNNDVRTVDGITIELKNLEGRWQLMSAQPDAQINEYSIFFPVTIHTGKPATLTLRFLPLKAGKADIGMTVSVSGQSHPAQTLTALAEIRDLGPQDQEVFLSTTYDSSTPVGSAADWVIGVENSGLVQVTKLKLRFRDLPASFQITGTLPGATTADNGRTLEFDGPLDPGSRGQIVLRVVPHAIGSYHITADMYVGDLPDPVLMASGASPLRFNVVVIRAGA